QRSSTVGAPSSAPVIPKPIRSSSDDSDIVLGQKSPPPSSFQSKYTFQAAPSSYTVAQSSPSNSSPKTVAYQTQRQHDKQIFSGRSIQSPQPPTLSFKTVLAFDS